MPAAMRTAASLGNTSSGNSRGHGSTSRLKPGNRAMSAQLGSSMPAAIDARSIQTRAATLDAFISVRQQTELPNSAEELFAPFMRSSKNLPDWAQRYMNLLAESTTTQGSMQTHLVKMLAKGAADLNKAAGLVLDPTDGITDIIADQSSRFILTNMDKVEWRVGGLAMPSFRRRASQSLDDTEQPGNTGVAAASAGGPSEQHAAKAVENGSVSTTGREHVNDTDNEPDTEAHQHQSGSSAANWKRLRMAVKTSAVFKTRERAKDDMCLPEQGQATNPVHAKALSVLLSMMMSGATSGVAASMPLPDVLHMQSSHNTLEVSQQQQATEPSQAVRAIKAAASFARAPSLAFRNADCSDSIIGISGMAASTAMKLLRSDSKSSEGLSHVFGAILETVGEADDRQQRRC